MLAAILKDVSWAVVLILALLFFVICFLAVLWSKREWNTRKIRVGMFLEREYRHDKEEHDIPEEDTATWPIQRRDDDAG